ncbi:hypothetical protein M885DRAFT_509475 [Pelagophyceae sp. CCMP2097]|nr:hypothetical protein M885DRAFT_509475 [Pelagophyceae sp. CCMP2097]
MPYGLPGPAALARIQRALQTPDLLHQLRTATPLIRVGPSGVWGAGLGVFAAVDIPAGTPLTWNDFPPQKDTEAHAKPYEENYLDVYEKLGRYGGADSSARTPDQGGVGHLINDAAAIDAMPNGVVAAPYVPDEVRTYLRDSEAGANIVQMPAPGGNSKIAFSDCDVEAGSELFKSYGVNYWLRPIETHCDFVGQYARCDLRLLAAQRKSPPLLARAKGLYAAAVERVQGLVQQLDDVRRTEPDQPAFQIINSPTSFEGLGVYAWIMMDQKLRSEYVRDLGDLDERYLDADELRGMREIRQLSDEDYYDVFCYEVPPYGSARHTAMVEKLPRSPQGQLLYSTQVPW